MAKIPFDIKFRPQIESGEYKVETRDGRSARIICWDKKNVNYPIAALVTTGDREYFYDYTRKGELHVSEEGIYDLFIVTPEPEMSEMETLLLSWLSLDTSGRAPTEWMKQEVKARATKLLSLAKQQLLLPGELLTQEHHEKLMETLREEALKDLPRWKTIKKNDNAIVRIPHVSTNMLGEKMLYIGENAISISCLMKLPGFKEDESHE